MWFKQVQFYEINSSLVYQPEALTEQLKTFVFTPCLPSLPLSLGWMAPLEQEGAPLVFAADGYMLICLGIAEKVLPAAVVKQALVEKVKEAEAKEHRRIGHRQKQALKEEVTQALLPQAFVKIQRLFACIDTRHQWLWLATTSSRFSDYFTMAWQKVFPEIGLIKPELRKVGAILTHWLQHHSHPKPFSIEKNAVLQDEKQQSRVIRCQQQDLFASSIQSLIKDGCEVRQLALTWQERMHFSLDDQLQLRTVRFSDEVIERQQDPLSETPELRMASDFILLTANLTELYQDLVDCFVKKEESVVI